jgi:catechol 2,3-dioxygenase-like lactoylglutathione lyase family enzyme
VNVSGFSHVAINVRDIGVALDFYVGTLGMRLAHRGEHDAYLEWGAAWLCVQERALLPAAPELGVDQGVRRRLDHAAAVQW